MTNLDQDIIEELNKTIDRVEKQRDELLTACKYVLYNYSAALSSGCKDKIRAAIAKAEQGEA